MATNYSSNRPATTLRGGNIKATIWQNVSQKGPSFATTFSRPFKDQAGAGRNGTSFGLNDLEALMNVAFEAKKWMTAHTMKRGGASHGSLGPSQGFSSNKVLLQSPQIGEAGTLAPE